jgi:hypothetical protein
MIAGNGTKQHISCYSCVRFNFASNYIANVLTMDIDDILASVDPEGFPEGARSPTVDALLGFSRTLDGQIDM